MTARLVRAALLLFALAALAPATRAETLGDALAAAYRNSGLLEQNRALLRAADEDVAAAVASMRPVLNYVISGSYSNYDSLVETTGASLALTASMVLYDFGRSRLRREAARENVLALRAALLGIEQTVLQRAVAAYVTLVRDQAVVALRETNLELMQQELQAARDRFEVGQITRTDVAFAEARLAASKSALAAAARPDGPARARSRRGIPRARPPACRACPKRSPPRARWRARTTPT